MQSELLLKLLSVAEESSEAIILVSNGNKGTFGKYNILAGFGAKRVYFSPDQMEENMELKLGIIPYSFKNQLSFINYQTEKDKFEWPEFYFFEPQQYYLEDYTGQAESNLNIEKIREIELIKTFIPAEFKADLEKIRYLERIEKIREKIKDGEFYEMNYCLEYLTNYPNLSPEQIFYQYNWITRAPFAAFVKWKDRYLICASPERFFGKDGNFIFSQPIKGTRKRIKDDMVADAAQITELESCIKEHAENVMITDLVRNDLSKISFPGSVVVTELCKIYSFSHVHQMISTVEAKLKENLQLADILQALFPMGSMTGAPKIEVMKNIDQMETFSRGLYSGSVGYILNGRMDFNVVIRSLQYHKTKALLGFHVGGAITYDSIAAQEWEECQNKAGGMLALFKEG